MERKTEAPTKVLKEKKRLSYLEKREFETLEKEIPQLEHRKAELTSMMSGGNNDFAALQKFSAELTEIMQQLEAKTDRWLQLSEFL